MNLICGIVEFILIITYGKFLFNFSTDQFPQWAMKYLNNSLSANSSRLVDQTDIIKF